jgi:hypothetical protein
MPVHDFGGDVGEIDVGIDAIEFAGLCRPPNYAERPRFPQYSW